MKYVVLAMADHFGLIWAKDWCEHNVYEYFTVLGANGGHQTKYVCMNRALSDSFSWFPISQDITMRCHTRHTACHVMILPVAATGCSPPAVSTMQQLGLTNLVLLRLSPGIPNGFATGLPPHSKVTDCTC